jgi:hypothetical protein
MSNFEKPKFRKYYPVPPIIESVYEYQDIDRDPQLRKKMTEFYHAKLLKWLANYPNLIKKLNSVDGQLIVYKLLRKFVKNSTINWYDLKDNYSVIKDYLYNYYLKHH